MAEPIIVIKDGSSCTVYVLHPDTKEELGKVHIPGEDINAPAAGKQAKGARKQFQGNNKSFGDCYVIEF